MSKSEIAVYQQKTHWIKHNSSYKYLAVRVIEEKFSSHKGDREQLRNDINNALFGKSYRKAVELKLLPTINKLYNECKQKKVCQKPLKKK